MVFTHCLESFPIPFFSILLIEDFEESSGLMNWIKFDCGPESLSMTLISNLPSILSVGCSALTPFLVPNSKSFHKNYWIFD